ncbi:MAG: hypothetical protein ACUVUC_13355 [Thermoguttaceae bacterium]
MAPGADEPQRTSSASGPEGPGGRIPPPRETQNLLVLALHQIVWRVGWTFKTETIIVPAFLDRLAGQGWVRGLLPLLKYLGQSVPPVFSAERLKTVRKKKWALAVLAVLASLPYLALAAIWLAIGGQKAWWAAAAFLAIHFLFFVAYGLYLMAFGTVQGKLIRPTRRGQLLWGATFWGLFPTILFCGWLMPGWLRSPVPGYGYLFLSVGIAFLAAALVACLLREPSSLPGEAAERINGLSQTVRALRRDRNLRRLVVLIVLSGVSLVIIPHYQAFARQSLGLTDAHLVLFVITHTTSVSMYSLLLGPVADLWGYRITLRLAILGAAIAPAYALCLPLLGRWVAPEWFWVVFIPLGLTPLVPTIMANYALELCPTSEHPRYLSIVNLALLPPYAMSPLVGSLVDMTSFETVALGTFVLMLVCGGLTFWLEEPRQRGGLAQIGRDEV